MTIAVEITTSAAHHCGSQRTTSPVGLPLFDHCALSGELYQEAVSELGAVHGAFNGEPSEGSEDAACVPTEGVRRTGKRTTPVDGFVLGLRRDNVLVGGMDLGQEACLLLLPGQTSPLPWVRGGRTVRSHLCVFDPHGFRSNWKSCQATYFCKYNYIHTLVLFQGTINIH